jgi:hypothetical protein
MRPDALPIKARVTSRIKTERIVCDGGKAEAGIKDKNDCTVRAIAHARCIPYAEAHEALRKAGRQNGKGFDIYYYLTRQPWARAVRWHECKTFDAFAMKYPKGHYILASTRHAVAVVDGAIYDSWEVSGLLRVDCAFEVIA